MLQSDRRHDPYPLTWELPLGAVTATLLLGALGVHLGRALANWFAGAGWSWPTPGALLPSLFAILAGDPTVGLATPPDNPASAAAVIGCIIAVEALLIAALAASAVWMLRRWGPGRLRGMATAAEAEAILGLSRLRRVQPIIRPDLGPLERRRRQP